jgi:hypothetical protein
MKSHGRLLKNQGDALAPNSLKLVRLGLKKITSFKQDGAGRDHCVRAKQPQDGCSEGAFSRARFPEDAKDLFGFKTETDSIERPESTATAQAISDSEISNFQNGSHARMLKQDSEANKTNVSHGEPKVILGLRLETSSAIQSVFFAFR